MSAMRLIDADSFLKAAKDIYKDAGWDPSEVHFSLNDLEMNLSGEPTVVVSDSEIIALLYSKLVEPVIKEALDGKSQIVQTYDTSCRRDP